MPSPKNVWFDGTAGVNPYIAHFFPFTFVTTHLGNQIVGTPSSWRSLRNPSILVGTLALTGNPNAI